MAGFNHRQFRFYVLSFFAFSIFHFPLGHISLDLTISSGYERDSWGEEMIQNSFNQTMEHAMRGKII